MELKNKSMPDDGYPDRDEESGKFIEEFPREEFLAGIREHGGTAATGEIADFVGCHLDTAYKKLQTLEKEGHVEGRKAGSVILWSLGNGGDTDE